MKIHFFSLLFLFICNLASSQTSYKIALNDVVEDYVGTTHMLSQKYFYNPPKMPVIPKNIHKYKLFLFSMTCNEDIKKENNLYALNSEYQNNNIIFLSGRTKDNLTKIIIPDRNFNLDFTDDTLITFDLTKKTRVHGELDNFNGENLYIKYNYYFENKIIERNVSVKVFHHDSSVMKIYSNPNDKDYIMFVRQHQRKQGRANIRGEDMVYLVQPYLCMDEYKENFYMYCKKTFDVSNSVVQYYTKDSLFRIANKLYSVSLTKSLDTLCLDETTEKAKGYELTVDTRNKIFNIQKNILGSNKVLQLDKLNNKYILIQFWGTWCKPCIQELPEVSNIYKQIDKEKIEFIGVACDFDSTKVKKFLKNNRYTWNNVFENVQSQINTNWSYLFKIIEYPHWVLLNPRREIIRKGNIPIHELTKIIDYEVNNH